MRQAKRDCSLLTRVYCHLFGPPPPPSRTEHAQIRAVRRMLAVSSTRLPRWSAVAANRQSWFLIAAKLSTAAANTLPPGQVSDQRGAAGHPLRSRLRIPIRVAKSANGPANGRAWASQPPPCKIHPLAEATRSLASGLLEVTSAVSSQPLFTSRNDPQSQSRDPPTGPGCQGASPY